MSSIAKCHDCGLIYGDPGWIETHLPQDVWKQIAPTSEGNGILCINCISRRLAERGFTDVPIVICGMEPITPVIDTTTAQFIAHGLPIMLILELERAAAVEAFRADLQPMVALHLVTIDAQERVALTHMGFGHGYAVSLWTQGVSPKLAKQWGWKGVPIPGHALKFIRPTEAEKRMVWDIHDPGKADEVNAWWNEDDQESK